MSHTWIYAFSDSGYEMGVKVGRSLTALGAWEAAPSYSPRAMHYVAGWRIQVAVAQQGTRSKAAAAVEADLHSKLGTRLERPRNGREWFEMRPDDAISRISSLLDREPDLREGHLGRLVTNDQFRNPHPRHFSTHPLKVVAWVYREDVTNHIKTQIIDDWTTPFEIRRRYSRNGFSEVAAFSYEGAPAANGNLQVLAAWTGIVVEFGHGPADHHYGWLDPKAKADEVCAAYCKHGLSQISLDSGKPPVGVRAAYNRPI